MKKHQILNSLFLLAFALSITAAVWQCQRMRLKYDIEQSTTLGWQSTPVAFATLMGSNHTLQPHYQHVTVSGHFLVNRDIFLDNKFHQHQVGYEVVSPFVVQESQRVLLINRGWVKKEKNRTIEQLDIKKLTNNAVNLTGIIDNIRSNPFILSRHEISLDSWPVKQLSLRPEVLALALNVPVYTFQLRLASDSPHALISSWQPVNFPWQRHLGYAIQWLLLALLSLVMLWVTNRSGQDKKSENSHEQSTTDSQHENA